MQTEKELFENLLTKHTVKEIAVILKVTKSTVYKKLKKYNLLKTSRTCNRYSVNQEFFKDIDTEEKAYWLGFLYADGCIYKGASKNSYRMQINIQASDSDVLEKFKNSIQANNPITYKTIQEKHNIATLKMNNTIFCEYLMSHGVIPRKSLICTFPEIDDNLVRHFIRGYFDGDGCISKYKHKNKQQFNITGGIDMLESIKLIFKENNINTYLYSINHSIANVLATSSKKTIKLLYDFLYDNSHIFLNRKKEKFEEIVL